MADDSSGNTEAVLFKAADNLHRNIDALEYKKPIAGTYHNVRNLDSGDYDVPVVDLDSSVSIHSLIKEEVN